MQAMLKPLDDLHALTKMRSTRVPPVLETLIKGTCPVEDQLLRLTGRQGSSLLPWKHSEDLSLASFRTLQKRPIATQQAASPSHPTTLTSQ